MWRTVLLLAGCAPGASPVAADDGPAGVSRARAPLPPRFFGVFPGSESDDPTAVLPEATVAHRLCHDLGGARAQLASRAASGADPDFLTELALLPDCADPGWCAYVAEHAPSEPVWWGGAWACPTLEARVFADGPDWLVRQWIGWRSAPWHPRLPGLLADTAPDDRARVLLGLAASRDPRSRAFAVAQDPDLARIAVPSRDDVREVLAGGTDPRDLPGRYAGFGAALANVLDDCAADPDEPWAHACAIAAVAASPSAARRHGRFPDLVADAGEACAALAAEGFSCAPDAGGVTAVDLLEASGHAVRVRGFVGEPPEANVYRLLAFAGLLDAEAGSLGPRVEHPDAQRRALFVWSRGSRFRVVEPPGAWGALDGPAALVNAALADAGRPERLRVESSGVRVVKGLPAALDALAAGGRVTLLPPPGTPGDEEDP